MTTNTYRIILHRPVLIHHVPDSLHELWMCHNWTDLLKESKKLYNNVNFASKQSQNLCHIIKCHLFCFSPVRAKFLKKQEHF